MVGNTCKSMEELQMSIKYFKNQKDNWLSEMNFTGLVAHNLVLRLLEKETPKKPKYEFCEHLYLCPNCKEFLITHNEKQDYSICCGQLLDWS